jgi:hypothetical protein
MTELSIKSVTFSNFLTHIPQITVSEQTEKFRLVIIHLHLRADLDVDGLIEANDLLLQVSDIINNLDLDGILQANHLQMKVVLLTLVQVA